MNQTNIQITDRIKMMFFIFLFFVISGCGDDDEEPGPITVNFTTTALALNDDNDQVEVTVRLSRPASRKGELYIKLDTGPLVMGQDGDFVISNTVSDNLMVLTFHPEQQDAVFTISSGAATRRQEEFSLKLSITESPDDFYQVGDLSTLAILFTENFISEGSTLVLNAGGADFSNRAYADLSKAKTETYHRNSYDLGFYSGAGYYVALNASAFHMAKVLNKFSLAEVTAQDTTGLGNTMSIPPPGFDASIGSVAWIDTPDGNLTTTAIGEIDAIDAENPVFILKRDDEDWMKFRITRANEGYSLDYAAIDETVSETIIVAKNTGFDMVTVKLGKGIVVSEPPNADWDFYYGTHTEIIPVGPGASIPYGFNDFIVTNRDDVKVAQVMTDDIAFDAFTADDLEGLTFSSDINALGSKWRMGGGPGAGPSLFTDRYFIIEDGDDLAYKVIFTSMFSLNGDRGKATFRYEILE